MNNKTPSFREVPECPLRYTTYIGSLVPEKRPHPESGATSSLRSLGGPETTKKRPAGGGWVRGRARGGGQNRQKRGFARGCRGAKNAKKWRFGSKKGKNRSFLTISNKNFFKNRVFA